MRPGTLPALLLLLVYLSLRPVWSSDVGKQPRSATAQSAFSVADFDWRVMVPYLFAASALPGEQGIKEVLENSRVLRAYVANEVRAECKPQKAPCAISTDSARLDGEITKRIDEIVQESILHQRKTAIVDYTLSRQPFPFSEIAALRSDDRPDAYLLLQFSGRRYTAMQLQARYGAPYDTDIAQWYSVFKYRLDDARYSSKAEFEVDPVDGAVIKLAISLKVRKTKGRR